MEETTPARFQRRVYPLDPRQLTQEELAVVFAMTSRRPEPFDEIQRLVTSAKAADFHERWVLGYGHASVAEHSVLHLAVENVSRLACDALEDNRLASYTEKSSRYQVLERGAFHVPAELEREPALRRTFVEACEGLFDAYHALLEGSLAHLASARPRLAGERQGAYDLRLRREATDSCRFVLPAATLTNVGVTINARSLEHAITKLLSSDLDEERRLGAELKEQARRIVPTLVRHAEGSRYLEVARDRLAEAARGGLESPPSEGPGQVQARLVAWDPEAQTRLVAALLYRQGRLPYERLLQVAMGMDAGRQEEVVAAALGDLGPHDAPLRELEQVEYTFEFLLDYGAYREFKRHRMQSYLPQPLSVDEGYLVPPLVEGAGLLGLFQEAMDTSRRAYHRLRAFPVPRLAEYAATHAHLRRVLTRVNLRELFHIFKLRTSPQAHFTIREAMGQALEQVRRVHPLLFKYIRLREE